jgi:hypothetical protein
MAPSCEKIDGCPPFSTARSVALETNQEWSVFGEIHVFGYDQFGFYPSISAYLESQSALKN